MKGYVLSDKEKLDKILEATGISRSELARRLEVSYKAVYRWLDKGIVPHPSQSRDIDQLFKEYVDLRGVVLQLRKKIKDPIRILKTDKKIRDRFFLDLTYHSNAIEGSRMSQGDRDGLSGKTGKGQGTIRSPGSNKS